MSSTPRPTVFVPTTDRDTVFHASRRCRFCPSGAAGTTRSAARRRGLVECEACYEERLQELDLPFELAASPPYSAPLDFRSLRW